MSDIAEDDVTLLTSELVTNAVLHGGSPFTVLVRYDGEHVRVEVGDGSRAVPHIREPANDATTGRGMVLIEELSAAWGTQPTLTGKRVWFELPVPAIVGGDEPAPPSSS